MPPSSPPASIPYKPRRTVGTPALMILVMVTSLGLRCGDRSPWPNHDGGSAKQSGLTTMSLGRPSAQAGMRVAVTQKSRLARLHTGEVRIGGETHDTTRCSRVARFAVARSRRRGGVLFALDLQRDVDERVLLAADQLALAGAVQQLV